MNTCKICHSELTNIKQVLRAKMKRINGKSVPNRIIYKAWCIKCEIYLRKTVHGRPNGEWETSHIKHNQLIHELTDHELSELKLEIEQNAKLDITFRTEKRWNEFISMKKENDKLYGYMQGDSLDSIKGYVIKRGSFLIGFYVHNTK